MATNSQFYLITSSNSPNSDGFHSIPAYTIGTGTMSTDNTHNGIVVAGTGTLFLTEVHLHNWLAASTSNYAREVEAIQDNSFLYVKSNFDSSLSGVKVLVIPRLAAKRISIFPQSGAAGKINGSAVTAAQTYKFESDETVGINPIQITVTGGTFEITIDY